MVEALTTDSNNLVCVQCWKTFEHSPAELEIHTEAVDCPHCGASVPIPDDGDFSGDVDLENAIAEEMPTTGEESDGSKITFGEDSFVEENTDAAVSDAGEDVEETVLEFEQLEEVEMIVEEEVETPDEPPSTPESGDEQEPEQDTPTEDTPEEKAEESPEDEAASDGEESEGDDAKNLTDVPEDLDPEGVVWKLLIPGGLTYNFHGLQALMRWASGKRNLDEVAVSLDGMRWRNCGKVLALVDSGTPVGEALRGIPTLDEESESPGPGEPPATPSVSEQLAGATEDLLEAINPTIELKGVTVAPPDEEPEALTHDGGVAPHVGDSRFGAGEIQPARSDTVPAVTGQFTFQVETNYKNLGEGKKWAVRILYTSVGIVTGLALGGVLHFLDLWKVIFQVFMP